MSYNITVANVNKNMRECQYAVRGEIYLAAVKRTQEGKEVIYTNVGNPQALGQRPISFNREVMSILMAPFILDNPNIDKIFAPDAIERAKTYLKHLNGGSLGAYSDSKGNPYMRQEIADFISRQCNGPSNPENIFISNGASECVRTMLFALIRGNNDGIMVPIPQYPLYSASIALYGGQLVPYYLNEDKEWALDIEELQRSLNAARAKGTCVRALVFINPGNPTGQCLSEENLAELVKFCHDNKLVMCADEVYQENIYTSKPFHSARKVMNSMPEPYRSHTEIASFHTVSKGAYGECGIRGGYMELHNMDPAVVEEIYKVCSINLCPNVPGQVALGLMLNPPKPGDYSYNKYRQEKDGIIESLKRRARMITEAFNSLEGVTCQETEGAMYSFPQITLPPAFIAKAKSMGKSPDTLYCLELLDETGLSCVPGSGFNQKPGTFHIRTTILPSEDQFDDIVGRFVSFHQGFMQRYSGSGSTRARL